MFVNEVGKLDQRKPRSSQDKWREFTLNYELSAVQMLGKHFQIEEEVQTGIYPLDIYLPEYKLVVEIDGSMHYYGWTKHELIKSKLKYRLLDKIGLQVLRLSYHDFGVR